MTTPSMREALAELVALKDLKDRLASGLNEVSYFQGGKYLLAEYERLKPIAWENARAALAAQPAAEPVAPFGWFYEMDSTANPKAGPVYLGSNDESTTRIVAEPEGKMPFPLYAATPAAAPQVPEAYVYDGQAVDEAVHAITHDEGEDDSVTVLKRVALALKQRADGASVWALLDRLEGDAAPQVTGERAPTEDETKQATADGEVHGDVRELRQMIEDCEPYLKDGETPAQRIVRERRDTEAVLNLLIREKRKTEQLSRGAPPAAVPAAWMRPSIFPECAPCMTVHRDEAQQWRAEGHEVRDLVYAFEAPKTLTDEQIDRIADNCAKAMPDGIRGFCKTWGWRQFARELLDVCSGHERAAVPSEPVAKLLNLFDHITIGSWLSAEMSRNEARAALMQIASAPTAGKP
jgi:hypothetical protein